MYKLFDVSSKNKISLSRKNANNKAWYKENIDIYEKKNSSYTLVDNSVSLKTKMKVNYDLFNNKLDMKAFSHVCKPFGDSLTNFPAKLTNKDILSPKIRAVLNMESVRPFLWTAMATNPEATTRKEQEEFKRVREYVINYITLPIRQEIELKKQAEYQGKELNPDEQQKIMEEIEQEVQAQTPESVKKYMKREHQDPSEVMANQSLKYFSKKLDIKKKFDTVFKHATISSIGAMFVGVIGENLEVWPVNSLDFNFDFSQDEDFIEDGEWANCTYYFGPSKLVSLFGDELTDKNVESIYDNWKNNNFYNTEDLFRLAEENENQRIRKGIPTVHTVWKSLTKIGFLTYLDERGVEREKIVDEEYELNTDFGDISIKWKWIPEVYEGWKICTEEPIYVSMRPLPGQHKDINNLYKCKLPYYGYAVDCLNSEPTSLMDRGISFQYLYNILHYRLEMLIASDKGKKLLMNIGSIPTSNGINLAQWQHFFESTPYAWFDPSEEGNDYQDANNIAKVLDMSLASDIQKYIDLIEYVRRQCGQALGVPEQVEGQMKANETASNAKQALNQSLMILEGYYELHNLFKRNVLNAMLEGVKVAFSGKKKVKLSYALDDLSQEIFDIEPGVLDNDTLDIFINNTSEAGDIKDLIIQLSHAAMQNQTVEFSDIISVVKANDMIEAEETLKVAEEKRRDFTDRIEREKSKAQADESEKAREFIREQHEMNKEIVILKEEERRKTVTTQAALTGMSFNPDSDIDNDGINDFLEIAKHGVNAEVQRKKVDLEKEKFEHTKEQDKINNKFQAEKLKNDKIKAQQKSVKV